jgi:hypothetical protein
MVMLPACNYACNIISRISFEAPLIVYNDAWYTKKKRLENSSLLTICYCRYQYYLLAA